MQSMFMRKHMERIINNIKNGKYITNISYFDRENYRFEENTRRELFHNDVIFAIKEDYNLNNAQAEKIYQYAWEDGHSEGYYEVLIYVERYAELVKECLNS